MKRIKKLIAAVAIFTLSISVMGCKMIGSFGLFTIILAVIGLIVGTKGFRERDKNYVTCKFGVGVNSVVLLALVGLFVRGIV